jgi:AraC-like DNA-binding protein
VGLHYAEYAPSLRLRDYVECYWSVQSDTAGALRVLPDGCMDIIALIEPRPGVRVVGTMTRSNLSELAPGLVRYGVRFRPGVLPALLRVDAREFADASVDIGAAALDRFACAETPRDFVRVVEDWLKDPPTLDPLQRAIAWTWRQDSPFPVCEAAQQAGLSDRQFRRVAQRLVGIPPKQFARIARFRRALAAGPSRGEKTWADVAAECGYYDQAHLVRDFNDFAGAAPGRFFQDAVR